MPTHGEREFDKVWRPIDRSAQGSGSVMLKSRADTGSCYAPSASSTRTSVALNIWFNRTFATTYWVMAMLRENPSRVPVRLFVTHGDHSSPVVAAADVVELEPALLGDDYVDWALQFCLRHAIDVFVPRLAMVDIARRLADFAAIGVAVLCSPHEGVLTLADKDATYRSARDRGVAVPPWRVARTADEFAAAFEDLRAELEPTERICMKPTVGVGGEGFRVLDDSPTSLADLLASPARRASVREVVRALDVAESEGREIPPLMLLPYLDAPEVSVDCLSRNGQLLAAVPRSKHARRSCIVNEPAAVAIARREVAAHRLSYLTNTQLRSWRGELVLLETNTRISGGLYQTALTGANLAWAAVQLALGQDVSLPPIALGAEFTQVLSLVRLAPAVPDRRRAPSATGFGTRAPAAAPKLPDGALAPSGVERRVAARPPVSGVRGTPDPAPRP